jgi:hypothetical protein
MRKGYIEAKKFPNTNEGHKSAVMYYRDLEQKGYKIYINSVGNALTVCRSINKVVKIAKRTGAVYKSKAKRYTKCDLCDSKAYDEDYGGERCTVYDGCADADKTAKVYIRRTRKKDIRRK